MPSSAYAPLACSSFFSGIPKSKTACNPRSCVRRASSTISPNENCETPGMLAIGFCLSIFSLTKRGRTKSCAFNRVSRTRLRRPGERRNRLGRWTSFLTKRGYAVRPSVARGGEPTYLNSLTLAGETPARSSGSPQRVCPRGTASLCH